jgi:hypothetical protein
MSDSMLSRIIRKALFSLGFRGYRASIRYYRGMATVSLNNGCTGVYSVHKGCFISWH